MNDLREIIYPDFKMLQGNNYKFNKNLTVNNKLCFDDKCLSKTDLINLINKVNSQETEINTLKANINNFYTKSQSNNRYYTMTDSNNRYSSKSHNHDNRYYTETESNNKYTQKSRNQDFIKKWIFNKNELINTYIR